MAGDTPLRNFELRLENSARAKRGGRDLTFSDVTVGTSPTFTLELHPDSDEANAAGVTSGDQAALIVAGQGGTRLDPQAT